MAGLLFITAPEANYKKINEALLSMRDWNNSNDDLDAFKLVTDRSATQNDDVGTPIPLKSLPENAWTNANLEEIEAYCLDLQRGDTEDEQKGAGLFIVVDSEGLENKTCILAGLPEDYYENPSAFRGRYDKIRVPWDDVYMIWCNLDIANMNFEEFVEEEEGEGDEQGWFTYQSIYEGDEEHEKGLARRDRKIEEWRRLGHV
jgi:hypothetical protein